MKALAKGETRTITLVEHNDAELVRQTLCGNTAAYNGLVQRYQRQVYNLAYRMLGREEDARDATQDAFLSALRKLPSFRGDAAFTTWMHRVTVNACYDILRKRLFSSLPDKAEIGDIASSYGRKLEEASKSKVANRGAEAIADEVVATYPFHPRLKNVIALFKENEQFKQTRCR